jgi:glycerol-3-phosphate acyltransferase PlsY
MAAAVYAPATFVITFFIDYMKNDFPLKYSIISTIAALIISIFVIVKHKENIGRLMRGEEKKITAKKK